MEAIPDTDEKIIDFSDENSNEKNDKEDVSVLSDAPDGGWGWVIVFASFMCNVIVDGIIFSYGLFIPELAEYFGETKGRLTWIGSILAGSYLIAGPAVSAFTNACGTRPITIIGALVSAISFAISSFAPNMLFLCISFGLLGGIGFGFIYLPAVVTVGFYFTRRRAFATGLAVCGSGVGTFIMTPIVKILLESYSWQNTMLVLSAIVLHCAIFGTLFRPLKATSMNESAEYENEKSDKPQQPLLQRIKEYRDAQKDTWESQEYLGITSIRPASFTSSNPEVSETLKKESDMYLTVSPNSTTNNNNNDSPPPSYSEIVAEDERISFLCAKQSTPLKNLPRVKSKRGHSLENINKNAKLSLAPEYLRPFYRQDILYSASLLNLPEFQSQPDLKSYNESVTEIPRFSEDDKKCLFCCTPVIRDTFRKMLDLSLLRSPTFVMFAVSGFLTLAGFFVPFMFIIDRAVTNGISADSATYILSIIGVTNTVGRVFSGWASDHPKLDALIINNTALIIGGLATILSPFANSFPVLIGYGIVFGFSIACFATLRSIIIVEILGLERLTNAFGLSLLFQGIASMIGAPVAGAFYDMTGSYNSSFYLSGSLILISGIISLPLRRISLWEKQKKEKESQMFAEIRIIVENTDTSPVSSL